VTVNANTDHACIDCARTNVVTVVQSAWVGSNRVHWHICPDCLRRYDEQTIIIKREVEQRARAREEAKAKFAQRTERSESEPAKKKPAKRRATAHGDLL
jgi:hypothetical protein